MEVLQYFTYFVIVCSFLNIGGFIVSRLVRVYKSINDGRGVMLGIYTILEMLHVADICSS